MAKRPRRTDEPGLFTVVEGCSDGRTAPVSYKAYGAYLKRFIANPDTEGTVERKLAESALWLFGAVAPAVREGNLVKALELAVDAGRTFQALQDHLHSSHLIRTGRKIRGGGAKGNNSIQLAKSKRRDEIRATFRGFLKTAANRTEAAEQTAEKLGLGIATVWRHVNSRTIKRGG